jgi:hypothetical protein
MMRWWHAKAKILGRCIVLVIFVAGAGSDAFDAAHADAGTALSVNTRTTKLIAGSFGSKGSLVSFSSRLEENQQAWGSPEVARLSLQVNSVLLDATYDARTGTLHLDGHGAALTAEDKEALIAFSNTLERSLGTASGLHEQLLYAEVLYWAEAPVGLPLIKRTLRVPPDRQGEKGPTATKDLLSRSCQQSDDDGILRFNGCSTVNRTLGHDTTAYCFMYESILSGPRASNCLGRCGPGCVICGVTTGDYTYDCAEHDRCCQLRGNCFSPWDASCGDEWWEAADDFIQDQRRCRSCR